MYKGNIARNDAYSNFTSAAKTDCDVISRLWNIGVPRPCLIETKPFSASIPNESCVLYPSGLKSLTEHLERQIFAASHHDFFSPCIIS